MIHSPKWKSFCCQHPSMLPQVPSEITQLWQLCVDATQGHVQGQKVILWGHEATLMARGSRGEKMTGIEQQGTPVKHGRSLKTHQKTLPYLAEFTVIKFPAFTTHLWNFVGNNSDNFGGQAKFRSKWPLSRLDRSVRGSREGWSPLNRDAAENMGADSWMPLLWMKSIFTYHHHFSERWWLFPFIWEFWENVQQFIPCLCIFFFFKVEIWSCALIPLLRPWSINSGSASWDDCSRVFPDELRASSFPW